MKMSPPRERKLAERKLAADEIAAIVSHSRDRLRLLEQSVRVERPSEAPSSIERADKALLIAHRAGALQAELEAQARCPLGTFDVCSELDCADWLDVIRLWNGVAEVRQLSDKFIGLVNEVFQILAEK